MSTERFHRGQIKVLLAGSEVNQPGARRGGTVTHVSERVVCIVQNDHEILKEVTLRAEKPVDIGHSDGFKCRYLNLKEAQREALRPASFAEAVRWRASSCACAALWIVVPAGLVATAFYGCLTAFRVVDYSAGVAASVGAFVGAPSLFCFVFAVRRIVHQNPVQGFCAFFLICWLAFCIAPLSASLYVVGPSEILLGTVAGGTHAVDVGVAISDAPPTGARSVTFAASVVVDAARSGGKVVVVKSPLHHKRYCTAPLVRALGSTEPVQYWALGYGSCCGDGSAGSVPKCWDVAVGAVGNAGGGTGMGSDGKVRALSLGTVHFSTFMGRIDLSDHMDEAKANAIGRHDTLSDYPGSIYVNIVPVLSGPGSVPDRLREEQGPAIFWALATGAIFMSVMLAFYTLLNFCKAATEDGGGYGPRSCLAIFGDPQVCDTLMCVAEADE